MTSRVFIDVMLRAPLALTGKGNVEDETCDETRQRLYIDLIEILVQSIYNSSLSVEVKEEEEKEKEENEVERKKK